MKEAINRLLTFKCDRKLKLTEGIGPHEVYGFADGGELVHGAPTSSAGCFVMEASNAP